MPLLHLAAKFDRYWFFHIVVKKGVTLDQLDINGCHALHHAACHSSINSLTYMTTLNYFANGTEAFLCNNGSTPLHIAILCGSAASTEYILQYSNYDKEPDDIKLKYLTLTLSVNVSSQQPNDADVIEKNVLIIFRMLIAHTSHLLLKDNNGIIVRYAISNGHYRVLWLLFSEYFVYFPNIINQKKLKSAVEYISHKKEFHFQPATYFNPKVQETQLLTSIYRSADPREYALLLTVDWVNRYQRLDKYLTKILIRELIRKQCVHVMNYIFLNAKNISFDQFVVLPEIIKYDKYGIISLLFYISIAHKYSEAYTEGMQEESVRNSYTCATCYLALKKCRLHDVALTYSKISELLENLEMVQLHEFILNYMFQKSSAHAMSSCYDKSGFNVLERAIQSGSPQLVHHLLQLNVQSDLQKDKLIELELDSLKYRKEEDHFVDSFSEKEYPNITNMIFVRNKDYIEDIISPEDFIKTSDRIGCSAGWRFHSRIRNNSDWVISELIKSFYSLIPQNKICLDPAAERFSIVHRLAFEGYTNSLKLLVLHYGKDILKCRNWNGFTPLFMSTLLDFADTKEYIESQGITLEHPDERAKTFLQYNIAIRFGFSRKTLHCIVKKNKFRVRRNYVYGLIKAYQCLKTNLRHVTDGIAIRFIKELKFLFIIISHLDIYLNSVNDAFNKMSPIMSSQSVGATKYPSYKLHFLNFFQYAPHRITKEVESAFAMIALEEKSCNLVKTARLKYLNYRVAALQNRPGCEYKKAMTKLLKSSNFKCTQLLFKHYESNERAYFLLQFKLAFEKGTVERISKVIKKASFFSYARQFCNNDILNFTLKWFSIYPQFEYMNALEYSKTYRNSFDYMLREGWVYNEYHNGVLRAQSFHKFGRNAYNIWYRYMAYKKGG